MSIVPEVQLRQLSRDFGSLISTGHSQEEIDSNVKHCQNVLAALFETSENASISVNHRAAACNALCGLLELSAASPHGELQEVAVRDDTWLRMLSLYLERYDVAKSKSMHQVLKTITRLLSKSQSSCSGNRESKALSILFDLIFERKEHIKVKPALLAVAFMISKDIINVPHLLHVFQQCRQKPDLSALGAVNLVTASEFLRHVMQWVLYQDIAPTAGHLIAVFCSKAAQQGLPQVSNNKFESHMPIWALPLAETARTHTKAISNFKNYVFPAVLKLSVTEFGQFLEFLRMDGQLQSSHKSDEEISLACKDHQSTQVNNLLYFSALEVAKDLGLVRLSDAEENPATIIQNEAIYVPDAQCGRILAHPSPQMRLAGLSLLVTSPYITTPFTRRSLRYLRQGLPHLLADTDAQFRSEVLGLVQQLIDQLRAAMANLAKELKRLQSLHLGNPLHGPTSHTLPTLVHGKPDQLFAAHVAFLTLYLDFVKVEVRPTSPYQRLITASKALSILLRSGLDSRVQHDDLSKRAQGEIRWPFHRQVLDPGLTRTVLDLLLNPFDDIRQVASSILQIGFLLEETIHSGPENSQSFSKEQGRTRQYKTETVTDVLIPYLKRAWAIMQRGGRADHADGVARLFQLIHAQCDSVKPKIFNDTLPPSAWWTSSLSVVEHLLEAVENTVDIAREYLALAVQEHPMHGILAGLRYIIDQPDFYNALLKESDNRRNMWRKVHERLYNLFQSIWECVRNVLCNDAPEGHMPEDVDDGAMFNTKDVLSYAWRALKEASLLLRAVIIRAPYQPRYDKSYLRIEDMKRLGDLCFLQLSELRHRGAFSTVAQSFAACSARCVSIKEKEIQDFIGVWYKGILECIRNKASTFTRRSAGIPALMVGILSAEPRGSLYHCAMDDLLRIAKTESTEIDMQETYLPQVHAMNCLRAIYTNSALGQASESYIAAGLDLAAERLSSDIWPIRNCGLMVFRALIDRLLGTSSSQDENEDDLGAASRLSYGRYPLLLDLIIRLLQAGLARSDTEGRTASSARSDLSPTAPEGVFPALELLRRAPPPSTHRVIILRLIRDLTGSPQWHIRDLAARTYAALIGPEVCAEEFVSLLNARSPSQNALHGQLLCAKSTLKRHLRSSPGFANNSTSLLKVICEQYHDLYVANHCPFTKVAYMDVLNVAMASELRTLEHHERVLADHHVCEVVRGIADTFIAQDDLLQSSCDNGSRERATISVLGKSAAVSLALFHLWSPSELSSDECRPCRPQILLGRLAAFDRNAALEAFRAVEAACSSTASKALAVRFQSLCGHILETIDDIDLRSVILEALARDTDAATPGALFAFRSEHLKSPTFRDVLHLSSEFGVNPGSIDRQLQIWGSSICARRCVEGKWTPALHGEVAEWIRMLRAAGQSSNDFDTRFAGVVSMDRFACAWSMRPRLSAPLFVAACLVLYDALNDDDDEIRDLGAKIVIRIVAPSKSVSGESDGVVPLVASQRLSELLARRCSDSWHLCQAALSRSVGTLVSKSNPFPPVTVILEQARKEDNALFIEEKQNLFVDEVREAVIWSRVLKRLSPRALHQGMVVNLQLWVMEGLGSLTATAKNERDGPLGWSSKPEVFTLGMRVIYGAEVLLDWESRTGNVTVTAPEILMALRYFADDGRENELHQLWLDRVEKILADSVVRRLGLLTDGMRQILSKL